MGLPHEEIAFLLKITNASAAQMGARLRGKLGIRNKKMDLGVFLEGM